MPIRWNWFHRSQSALVGQYREEEEETSLAGVFIYPTGFIGFVSMPDWRQGRTLLLIWLVVVPHGIIRRPYFFLFFVFLSFCFVPSLPFSCTFPLLPRQKVPNGLTVVVYTKMDLQRLAAASGHARQWVGSSGGISNHSIRPESSRSYLWLPRRQLRLLLSTSSSDSFIRIYR